MKDRDEEDLFSADDIPVSGIARYFEPQPQDDMARAYLAESIRHREAGLKGGHRNPSKKILKVFTAHKGETLNGVLEEIKKDGWGYATLGDWYRYHIKHPFPEGEIIATPGTIHLDENFNKWIPSISSLKRSLFQKITGREKKVIAKIHLKKEAPLAIFSTERKFLIYRVIKDDLSKKLKGPS